MSTHHLTLTVVTALALTGCPSATTTGDDAGITGVDRPLADVGGPIAADCAPSVGAGTEHRGDVTAGEVWTEAASPHRIVGNVRILATVRVEACAVVELAPDVRIAIGDSTGAGVLQALGQVGVDAQGQAVQRRVRFRAADPANAWGSLVVDARGRLELEHVDLIDGASPRSAQNGGGVILAYGTGDRTEPVVVTRNVRVNDVLISRPRGHGVNLTRLSGFMEDSEGLAIERPSDGTSVALRVEVGAAWTLPALRPPTAEIELVAGNTALPGDETIRALGVPYRVTNVIRVAPFVDGPAVTLRLEPGVVLRFDPQNGTSGIRVGISEQRPGLLVAAGTADAPITLTSAKSNPAPADWHNLYFAFTPSQGNRLEHVRLEYAGAPSGAQNYGCGPPENDATILWLAPRPTTPFLQSSTLRAGGGDTGIVLGWTSDEDGPDLVSTNTFEAMPPCRVSRWRSATGAACPGSVNGSPVCL